MVSYPFEKVIFVLQKIIDSVIKRFGKEPDALIGIHSRWTDYSGHLQLRGGKLVKNKFYSKAIQYFRKKHINPLFLVTSDDPGKAKTFICNPQRNFKGTYDCLAQIE